MIKEALEDRAEEIKELLKKGEFLAVKEHLNLHPVDIAELMRTLDREEKIIIFRLLPKDEAVEVFEHLDIDEQSELLEGFTDKKILALVNDMSPDDRARLFDELPAKVVKKLLSQMSREEWLATSVLLGFKEGTAGRIMTPEYVSLKKDMTVNDALRWIRTYGHNKETIYYLYVVDDTRRLIGVVSLKDLVLADGNTKIVDLMDTEVIKVYTEDDQEKVAEVIKDYDLIAVPVVDKEDRLVGIITVDDIVDVIEEEATEDILRMGGVEMADRGYFKSSIVSNISRRIVWLLFVMIMSTLTGNVIMNYERVLESMVILAAFMPVLTGTGGNAGSQSSAVVIRGLATGEVEIRDAIKVLLREVVTSIGLGVVLGCVAFVWAYYLQGLWSVALVVGLSCVAIVMFSTALGTSLPILFKKMGFDPAFISTPFLTTASDITALLIYFNIAKRLLNL